MKRSCHSDIRSLLKQKARKKHTGEASSELIILIMVVYTNCLVVATEIHCFTMILANYGFTMQMVYY